MKNFKLYNAQKYNNTDEYEKVEEGIYKNGDNYVTSLSFEIDNTRFGEEEGCPQDIPQTPFEDLLDEYKVWVEDFYEDLNESSEVTCYQEFASSDIDDIRKLLTIIGRQFYAVENEEDSDAYEIVSRLSLVKVR